MEPHIILFVSTCPLSNYCTKLIIGFDYPDLDTLLTVQHCASLPLMIYILFTTYLQINKKAFLKILVHFYKNPCLNLLRKLLQRHRQQQHYKII